MNEAIELDAYRPHITIECMDEPEPHVHILPVAYLVHIARNDPVEPLEPCLIRRIVADLLTTLGESCHPSVKASPAVVVNFQSRMRSRTSSQVQPQDTTKYTMVTGTHSPILVRSSFAMNACSRTSDTSQSTATTAGARDN